MLKRCLNQSGSAVMKLVILDRDGVINFDSPHYIKSPEEWQPIPGSLESISLLKKAGYIIAVATNQSGIGRGLYNEAILTAIHSKMQKACLALGGQIDKIVYCPHTPQEQCICRKPKIGLLTKISDEFNCSLENVPVMGDRLSDIIVAREVGAYPVLIKTRGAEHADNFNTDFSHPLKKFDNLFMAVTCLLTQPQHFYDSAFNPHLF